MQGKDSTKSTFNQLLEELSNLELFNRICKELNIDKYVKKLTFDKLVALNVLALLRQYKGLWEISSCLKSVKR